MNSRGYTPHPRIVVGARTDGDREARLGILIHVMRADADGLTSGDVTCPRCGQTVRWRRAEGRLITGRCSSPGCWEFTI